MSYNYLVILGFRENQIMAHKSRPSFATSAVLVFFTVQVVVVGSSSNHPGKPQLVDRGQPARDSSPLLPSALSSVFSDAAYVHYEPGVTVETVLDGNHLGMSIYNAVPFQDFVFALDSTYSQILKIQLPIDQSKPSSRGAGEVALRVAGNDWGRTGYADGWSDDSLLDHPKGLAVDGDGNVYVADVKNRVIRKVTPAGYVSTLAGQSNSTGHADGEGKVALFSSDFDLTYLPKTCSLLISDRGNRRLRMIQLKPGQKCSVKEPSDHLWGILCGILVILSAVALGFVEIQKRELQRYRSAYFALEGDGGLPISRNRNATRPLLANSSENPRDGRITPDDVLSRNSSNPSDLINFLDERSPESEYTGRANRLENSVADGVGDADTDVLQCLPSSVDDEADGTCTPERVTFQLQEHDLPSDSESILIGPNDSFSRHIQNSSALVVPDWRIRLEEESDKCLLGFRQNTGN